MDEDGIVKVVDCVWGLEDCVGRSVDCVEVLEDCFEVPIDCVGTFIGSGELVSPNTAVGAGVPDGTFAELLIGNVADVIDVLVARVLSESPKTAVGAGNAFVVKAEDEEDEEAKFLPGYCKPPLPATNTYGCEESGGGGKSTAFPRYGAACMSPD